MNARLALAALAIALALPVAAGATAADQVVRAQTPFKQSPVVRLPALPERAASEATQMRQTPFKQSPRIDRRDTIENPLASGQPGAAMRGHIALKQYPTQRLAVHGNAAPAQEG